MTRQPDFLKSQSVFRSFVIWETDTEGWIITRLPSYKANIFGMVDMCTYALIAHLLDISVEVSISLWVLIPLKYFWLWFSLQHSSLASHTVWLRCQCNCSWCHWTSFPAQSLAVPTLKCSYRHGIKVNNVRRGWLRLSQVRVWAGPGRAGPETSFWRMRSGFRISDFRMSLTLKGKTGSVAAGYT